MRAIACRLAALRLPAIALTGTSCYQPSAPAVQRFCAGIGTNGNSQHNWRERFAAWGWTGLFPETLSKVLEITTEGLKDESPEVQAEAALQLGRLTTNAHAMSYLRTEFAAHGTIQALADALISSHWNVKALALTNLTCIATLDIQLAEEIPLTVYTSLVSILQQASQVDDQKERTHIQASAAVLAGEMVGTRSPGVAALDIVPQLVNLLDVRNQDNTVCIGAAFSLMQLGVSGAVLLQAVKESGAFQKLFPWLSCGELDRMRAAVKTIATLGRQLLPDDEGKVV